MSKLKNANLRQDWLGEDAVSARCVPADFFEWFLDMERQKGQRSGDAVFLFDVRIQPGAAGLDGQDCTNAMREQLAAKLRITDVYTFDGCRLKLLVMSQDVDTAIIATERLRAQLIDLWSESAVACALYVWDYRERRKRKIIWQGDDRQEEQQEMAKKKRRQTPETARLMNKKAYAGRLQSLRYRCKRALEWLLAFVGMIVLLPLFVLLAIAIKIDSRGPVLFSQWRVGLNGDLFRFYKFRSMRSDSDDAIHKEFVASLIEGGKPEENGVFKMQHDPRITRLGRILRQTSLDELPQLLNVVRGEMNLVGPRPAIPYEVEAYQPWHLARMEVHPGVTGYWQVFGRSRTSFAEMCRMDIHYIRRWTLWLDIKLVFLTFAHVLKREGAY